MAKRAPPISAATMDALTAYPWPGNIRQLQNVIERAVILATGERLEVHLPAAAALAPPPPRPPVLATIDDVLRAHILTALAAADWVIGGPRGAAVKLGMKRSTLNFRIKKLGITKELRRARAPLE